MPETTEPLLSESEVDAIEARDWFVSPESLEKQVALTIAERDALIRDWRAMRASLRAAVASIKVNDQGQPLDRACPWSLDWYSTASAILDGQSFDPQPQYEKGFEAGTAFAKSTIEDLQSENAALRERLAFEQGGRR